MAKKLQVNEVQKGEYVAFADFSVGRKDFKAGDAVRLPEGYELDAAANQFRNVERKGKMPKGLVFKYPTGVINKETREEEYKSTILPIE